MGWYFTGLVVVLILLSISYSNNLLLIFSLLFLSLGIIWATESFFQNKGLASYGPQLKDIFADEKQGFRLPQDAEFLFYNNDKEVQLKDHFPRGLVKIDQIKAKTTRPFGLFEFSESRKVDFEFYVYPSRIQTSLPTSHHSDDSVGNEFSTKNKEDLTGLSRYQEGHNSRIHWKYFAKTHELVMKEMEGSSSPDILLELADNPTEEMLSGLAYEIHRRKVENKEVSLKIGDEVITDYHEALRRLALW